jgi:hypothetical protein
MAPIYEAGQEEKTNRDDFKETAQKIRELLNGYTYEQAEDMLELLKKDIRWLAKINYKSC